MQERKEEWQQGLSHVWDFTYIWGGEGGDQDERYPRETIAYNANVCAVQSFQRVKSAGYSPLFLSSPLLRTTVTLGIVEEERLVPKKITGSEHVDATLFHGDHIGAILCKEIQ